MGESDFDFDIEYKLFITNYKIKNLQWQSMINANTSLITNVHIKQNVITKRPQQNTLSVRSPVHICFNIIFSLVIMCKAVNIIIYKG